MPLTNEQKSLYKIYQVATIAYSRALSSKIGTSAIQYLNKRHISLKTAQHYHLGFAPGHNYLKHAIAKYHFSNYIMRKSGLFHDISTYGGLRDRYYNRLMFPIMNKNGHTISFSGRKLSPKSKAVKYLVTANTPIFKKRDAVFGLPNALERMKDKQAVIIVEGNFDVLSLYQAGIHNVIATLGCNFMWPQIRLIKPYVTNIFLCYDGDKPGQTGIYKNIKKLYFTHLKIWALKWPAGLDPAGFYVTFNGAYLRKYFLKHYIPAVQFLMFHRLKKLNKLAFEITRQLRFVDYSVKVIMKYIHPNKARYPWFLYLAKREHVSVKDIITSARNIKNNHLYYK